MTEAWHQTPLVFDAADQAADANDALVVDLDGYEGPLHVLLALARAQKVDLLKISITRLAEQFLAFVHAAQRRRFALAADYLVMAAWLAYLKSRLLLPKREQPKLAEAPAEDLAAQLAFRLAKLQAMRTAADQLAERPQLKRDVFPRGDPEAIQIRASHRLEGSLYALMRAYIMQRRNGDMRRYRPSVVKAYPLEAARDRLRGLIPRLKTWTALAGVVPEAESSGPSRASYVASTLSASLELVKDGSLEARQLEAFADIYVRARFAAVA